MYCNNFDIFSFKTVLLPVSKNLQRQAQGRSKQFSRGGVKSLAARGARRDFFLPPPISHLPPQNFRITPLFYPPLSTINNYSSYKMRANFRKEKS